MIEFSRFWLRGCWVIRLYFLIFAYAAFAQASKPFGIYELLLDERQRPAAITKLRSKGGLAIPELLSVAKRVESEHVRLIEARQVAVELADLFGEFKAKEAIPFLSRHLLLQRYINHLNWLKTEDVMRDQLPCANALILIGPPAETALIQRYFAGAPSSETNVILLIISNISSKASRNFLIGFRAEAAIGQDYVKIGLARMDKEQLDK